MELIKENPKTFIVAFTEKEIFNLVYRLKFIRIKYNMLPDPTEHTWLGLEKLIGPVEPKIDLY